MTQDYKDILLKYLTNNLSKESGVNIPEFSEVQNARADDLFDELDSAFTYGYRQKGVVQCKNANGEYNGFIIVYGAYYTDSQQTDSTAKGYMLLFDNNFNLVQIIKQYKSGTDCGIFMKVIVLNDGTLVALDHTTTNRIVMLNNPSVKLPSVENYELVLRTSYNLQGNVANISYTMNSKDYVLDKDPNSGNYLIGALDPGTGFEALTQLKVQVGMENVWTNYSYTPITGGNNGIQDILSTFVYWQNEIPYISVYNAYRADDPTHLYENDMIWKLYKSTNNGTTSISNATTIYDLVSLVALRIRTENFEYGGATMSVISDTNFYITLGIGTQHNDTLKTDLYILTTHFNGDYVYECYLSTFTGQGYDFPIAPYFDIDMYNINGTICMIYAVSVEQTLHRLIMESIGVLITSNNDSAEITISYPVYLQYNQFHINAIVNQFDLYKFFILNVDNEIGDSLNSTDIIYNYLYYNGTPYENVNSLKANQGMLYDSTGNIFVRGIYNHIVSDNLTEDTIQIPNTMVNDIQIIQNKLLSQTNQPMVINNDTIEKNIYETLYINYFNELNIENRNTAYYIPNKNAAIRLNNSISNLTDYDDATITKYKINYHDNTSVIKSVDCSITNHIATFNIGVYTGKLIDSIELISNDETTTYQIIDCTSLELNKLYSITQECYVD